MGAAGSVQMLYKDSIRWFQKYFDSESAHRDFNQIDIDHDGGISYKELKIWLQKKAASEGGAWKAILANSVVFSIAHRQAVKKSSLNTKLATEAMYKTAQLGMKEFQVFLLHLFAVSVLWVHYKNADTRDSGDDLANETFTNVEFRLACRSFNVAVGNEQLQLSDEQLDQDFRILDIDSDGFLRFDEVCEYCCQALDIPCSSETSCRNQKMNPFKRSRSLAHMVNTVTDSHAWMQDSGSVRGMGQVAAIDAMARELERNKNIATFVEMKLATEVRTTSFVSTETEIAPFYPESVSSTSSEFSTDTRELNFAPHHLITPLF